VAAGRHRAGVHPCLEQPRQVPNGGHQLLDGFEGQDLNEGLTLPWLAILDSRATLRYVSFPCGFRTLAGGVCKRHVKIEGEPCALHGTTLIRASKSSTKPKRDANGHYLKGQSGNPAGRTSGSVHLTTLARQYTGLALKTLAEICQKGRSEPARVSAAGHLLDRAHGKPHQAIEHLSGEAGPLSITIDWVQPKDAGE